MTPRTVVAVLLAALVSLPLVEAFGPGADPLAGLPDGSYVMDDGMIAIPMTEPAPAWVTDEVFAAAGAAAEKGMAYDWEQGIEVPLGTQFAFIRPGTFYYGPGILQPVGCTMNFIYGAAGSYKIGTAGHCTEKTGEEAIVVTAPTVVVSIGKTSKTTGDGGVGRDWALIAIYPQFQQHVDANVPVIQGPQGSSTVKPTLTSPMPVKHFGHGLVVGTGGTPRVGVSTKADTNAFYFNSPSMPGDSGSPVLTGGSAAAPLGQAFGVLTHLIVDTRHVPSHMAGTRISVVTDTVKSGDINPLPPA